MMSVWQICGIALLSAFGGMILREMGGWQQRVLLMLGGIVLGGALLARLLQFQTISTWLGEIGAGEEYPRLWKGLGICLAVEFCAGLCRTCGAEELGKAVELIGRAEILFLALPLIKELLSLTEAMLQ